MSHNHTNQALNVHVSAVHEENKLYQCPIYDSAFAHNSSLVKHIDVIHEKVNQLSIETKVSKNVNIGEAKNISMQSL